MPIVYTRLSGGLGNQLFIIYSCIATALRDKADFVIQGTYDSSSVVDESYVRRTYWDTPMFEKVKKYAKNNNLIKAIRRVIPPEPEYIYM